MAAAQIALSSDEFAEIYWALQRGGCDIAPSTRRFWEAVRDSHAHRFWVGVALAELERRVPGLRLLAGARRWPALWASPAVASLIVWFVIIGQVRRAYALGADAHHGHLRSTCATRSTQTSSF